MPRKRQVSVDKQQRDEFTTTLRDWEAWDKLAQSDSGKFLIRWLDAAIEETMDTEDKTDVYKLDSQAREYFFSSVRSKRQTLKAIKDKLLKSKAEKEWWIMELSKLTPEGE